LYAQPLTLDSYFLFLKDPYYREIAATTVYMSAGASVLTVFIAYPIAYAIVRSARLRRVILPIVALSFFVSALVLLYGLLGILSRGGPLVAPINELGSGWD
jgi:ABC-type spermidine/putrescine transport system permease subunit I